nr:MAG TPA: hypothetical protein [Caudoviricetes sp.]
MLLSHFLSYYHLIVVCSFFSFIFSLTLLLLFLIVLLL